MAPLCLYIHYFRYQDGCQSSQWQAYDGVCYQAVRGSMTFHQAAAICVSQGGYIVPTITSQEQLDFFRTIMASA